MLFFFSSFLSVVHVTPFFSLFFDNNSTRYERAEKCTDKKKSRLLDATVPLLLLRHYVFFFFLLSTFLLYMEVCRKGRVHLLCVHYRGGSIRKRVLWVRAHTNCALPENTLLNPHTFSCDCTTHWGERIVGQDALTVVLADESLFEIQTTAAKCSKWKRCHARCRLGLFVFLFLYSFSFVRHVNAILIFLSYFSLLYLPFGDNPHICVVQLLKWALFFNFVINGEIISQQQEERRKRRQHEFFFLQVATPRKRSEKREVVPQELPPRHFARNATDRKCQSCFSTSVSAGSGSLRKEKKMMREKM